MKSFTTDFEEGLINGFLFAFKDKIKDLHHYGFFFIISNHVEENWFHYI
jgi:hypothetical protein